MKKRIVQTSPGKSKWIIADDDRGPDCFERLQIAGVNLARANAENRRLQERLDVHGALSSMTAGDLRDLVRDAGWETIEQREALRTLLGADEGSKLALVCAMLPALEENRATKAVARKLRGILDG
jgi:hypothetical protein